MENNILDLDLNEGKEPIIELASPSKFIVLFLTSFGLYAVWWMYKMWRFFKAQERANYHPALRAFFAVFFLAALFDRIQNFAKTTGYTKQFSSAGLFVLYLVLNFIPNILSNNAGSEILGLISLFGFIVFLPPLQAYNYAILQSKDYQGEIVSKFNGRQILVLVLGMLFWMLVVTGLMLPVEEVY